MQSNDNKTGIAPPLPKLVGKRTRARGEHLHPLHFAIKTYRVA